MSKEVKAIAFDAGFEVVKVGEVATLTYKDEDAFFANTDLDANTLKEVDKYRKNYINTALEKAGSEALEVMKKDKGIKTVEVSFPIGVSKQNSLNVEVLKEKEVRVPGETNADGSLKTITKPAIRVKVKDSNFKASKTSIRKWEDSLKEALYK